MVEVFIVLHWFLPESSGIRGIPGIPEESILAEGPAKLTKQFWRNFEWNSNSAGMQELPSTEFYRNGIHGMCRVPNDIQIERQQTPMLDLDVVNKQILSHHYHHHWRRPPTVTSLPTQPRL
jgi:hypothetical protein